MVAERGSVEGESSSHQITSRSALNEPQKKVKISKTKELFGSDGEHESSTSTKVSATCPVKTDSKNRSVIEADLSVSSSDDNCMELELQDKNLVVQIENELCEKPIASQVIRDRQSNTEPKQKLPVAQRLSAKFDRPKSLVVVASERAPKTNRNSSNWGHRPNEKPKPRLHPYHHQAKFNRKPNDRGQDFKGKNSFVRHSAFQSSQHRLISRDPRVGPPAHSSSYVQVPPTATVTSRPQTLPDAGQSISTNDNITLSVDSLLKLINNNKPKRKQSHGRAQRLQKSKEAQLKREKGFEAWWEQYGKHTK